MQKLQFTSQQAVAIAAAGWAEAQQSSFYSCILQHCQHIDVIACSHLGHPQRLIVSCGTCHAEVVFWPGCFKDPDLREKARVLINSRGHGQVFSDADNRLVSVALLKPPQHTSQGTMQQEQEQERQHADRSSQDGSCAVNSTSQHDASHGAPSDYHDGTAGHATQKAATTAPASPAKASGFAGLNPSVADSRAPKACSRSALTTLGMQLAQSVATVPSHATPPASVMAAAAAAAEVAVAAGTNNNPGLPARSTAASSISCMPWLQQPAATINSAGHDGQAESCNPHESFLFWAHKGGQPLTERQVLEQLRQPSSMDWGDLQLPLPPLCGQLCAEHCGPAAGLHNAGLFGGAAPKQQGRLGQQVSSHEQQQHASTDSSRHGGSFVMPASQHHGLRGSKRNSNSSDGDDDHRTRCSSGSSGTDSGSAGDAQVHGSCQVDPAASKDSLEQDTTTSNSNSGSSSSLEAFLRAMQQVQEAATQLPGASGTVLPPPAAAATDEEPSAGTGAAAASAGTSASLNGIHQPPPSTRAAMFQPQQPAQPPMPEAARQLVLEEPSHCCSPPRSHRDHSSTGCRATNRAAHGIPYAGPAGSSGGCVRSSAGDRASGGAVAAAAERAALTDWRAAAEAARQLAAHRQQLVPSLGCRDVPPDMPWQWPYLPPVPSTHAALMAEISNAAAAQQVQAMQSSAGVNTSSISISSAVGSNSSNSSNSTNTSTVANRDKIGSNIEIFQKQGSCEGHAQQAGQRGPASVESNPFQSAWVNMLCTSLMLHPQQALQPLPAHSQHPRQQQQQQQQQQICCLDNTSRGAARVCWQQGPGDSTPAAAYNGAWHQAASKAGGFHEADQSRLQGLPVWSPQWYEQQAATTAAASRAAVAAETGVRAGPADGAVPDGGYASDHTSLGLSVTGVRMAPERSRCYAGRPLAHACSTVAEEVVSAEEGEAYTGSPMMVKSPAGAAAGHRNTAGLACRSVSPTCGSRVAACKGFAKATEHCQQQQQQQQGMSRTASLPSTSPSAIAVPAAAASAAARQQQRCQNSEASSQDFVTASVPPAKLTHSMSHKELRTGIRALGPSPSPGRRDFLHSSSTGERLGSSSSPIGAAAELTHSVYARTSSGDGRRHQAQPSRLKRLSSSDIGGIPLPLLFSAAVRAAQAGKEQASVQQPVDAIQQQQHKQQHQHQQQDRERPQVQSVNQPQCETSSTGLRLHSWPSGGNGSSPPQALRQPSSPRLVRSSLERCSRVEAGSGSGGGSRHKPSSPNTYEATLAAPGAAVPAAGSPRRGAAVPLESSSRPQQPHQQLERLHVGREHRRRPASAPAALPSGALNHSRHQQPLPPYAAETTGWFGMANNSYLQSAMSAEQRFNWGVEWRIKGRAMHDTWEQLLQAQTDVQQRMQQQLLLLLQGPAQPSSGGSGLCSASQACSVKPETGRAGGFSRFRQERRHLRQQQKRLEELQRIDREAAQIAGGLSGLVAASAPRGGLLRSLARCLRG